MAKRGSDRGADGNGSRAAPPADPTSLLTARQQNLRARIMSSARELLTERGYDGVTMRELAEMSGVALKTLYDIYGSKDDLLIASVKDRIHMVFRTAEAGVGQRKGLDRVLYYVEAGAIATVATPILSKAITPFVAGPVDRFGFNEIYHRYHALGLRDIEEAGGHESWVDRESLLQSIFMALTGVLLVWSKDQIEVEDLVAYSRLATAQAVLPAVKGKTQRAAHDTIKACYAQLYATLPDRAGPARPSPAPVGALTRSASAELGGASTRLIDRIGSVRPRRRTKAP